MMGKFGITCTNLIWYNIINIISLPKKKKKIKRKTKKQTLYKYCMYIDNNVGNQHNTVDSKCSYSFFLCACLGQVQI